MKVFLFYNNTPYHFYDKDSKSFYQKFSTISTISIPKLTLIGTYYYLKNNICKNAFKFSDNFL